MTLRTSLSKWSMCNLCQSAAPQAVQRQTGCLQHTHRNCVGALTVLQLLGQLLLWAGLGVWGCELQHGHSLCVGCWAGWNMSVAQYLGLNRGEPTLICACINPPGVRLLWWAFQGGLAATLCCSPGLSM